MAKLVDVGSIASYFESLDDPRHTRNRKHLLVDIAVIAVCGIVCGCDGPTAIHRWAKHRATWLARTSPCPTASLRATASAGRSSCSSPRPSRAASGPGSPTRSWTDTSNPDRLVAIDGKACRGSHDHAKDLGALHIVSAWATEEGIALGQVATDAKSNEITAIPQLLEQIDLKRHADHDRRDGLPEGDRQADRRRRRRLRDRGEGQPAEARRPRSRRSSSTTWRAT